MHTAGPDESQGSIRSPCVDSEGGPWAALKGGVQSAQTIMGRMLEASQGHPNAESALGHKGGGQNLSFRVLP